MEGFLAGLPKAELHLHIEGTMEPELMVALANRNGVQLGYNVEEIREKRSNFTDLQDFLNLYYAGCSVLLTEQDFYDLAASYFTKAVTDSVKYAEIFFDPQSHTDRGVAFSAIIGGLTRAAEDFADRIEVHYILSFLRHLSEESAIAMIETAKPFASLIWGIGLDSSELPNPPRQFRHAYHLAQSSGLCGADGTHKTAHACEEGDPSYAIEALSVLGCRRLDHGVRVMEDQYLVKVLKDNQVPLTVCPWSNCKLMVEKRFFDGVSSAGWTLKMLEAGLLVSINSDDPAYFGRYVASTMSSVLGHLQPDVLKEKAKAFARNSFLSAFMSEERKRYYLEMVERYEG